jgi:mono/diheme cytochrome c family protein
MALTLMGGVVYAQAGKPDPGKQECQENCAVCHANNGKGVGSYVDFLRKAPPDLTQLTKTNGAVFPVNRMYQMIEGDNVPSHGSSEMSVWGREYQVNAAQNYIDMPYDPEPYVRAHILTLIEYINRLQER